MKEHIIELESRIAFQDEAINSLSETVASQQEILDVLISEMNGLRQKLKALEPSPLQDGDAEPPPPHY